eukprot:1192973-Rhodomonas_salina.4
MLAQQGVGTAELRHAGCARHGQGEAVRTRNPFFPLPSTRTANCYPHSRPNPNPSHLFLATDQPQSQSKPHTVLPACAHPSVGIVEHPEMPEQHAWDVSLAQAEAGA